MSNNTWYGKILRFVGIVLMGLTGGFTFLGGLGTICAALYPDRYDSMSALIPFQWLYILFMVTSMAIGIWGIVATVQLIRGTPKSYLSSVLALAVGLALGSFHIYMSRLLRGKSMPADAVVYTTLFTLAVFLLFRIPGIWSGVDFSRGNSRTNRGAGGAAAIVVGLLTLGIQYLMASTHTWDGINYAAAFNWGLWILGGLLMVGGIAYWLSPLPRSIPIAAVKPGVTPR